jgi:hypothetical protein
MANESTRLVMRGLLAGVFTGVLLLTGCASAGGGSGDTGFSAPETSFANQQSFGTSDFAQIPSTAPPADPWPRDLSISNAAVLVYQPQINSWNGNQIDFRAALAIKPSGAQEETFGVVFASARTQVDKVTRTVVFENLRITKSDFPTPAGFACRIGDQTIAGSRHQSSTTDHRQLLAGDPGAHRWRAGAQTRRRLRPATTRYQYAGADPHRWHRCRLLPPCL